MKKIFNILFFFIFIILSINFITSCKKENIEPSDDIIYENDIRNFVSLENQEFEYDGNKKSLSLKGNMPSGVEVIFENNEQINPGIYSVKATFNQKSNQYRLVPLIATMTNNKIKIDKDNIIFENQEFDYDSNYHSISASNIPDSLNVTYINNNKKEPGEYKVIAHFDAKDDFHEAPEDMEASLIIKGYKLTSSKTIGGTTNLWDDKAIIEFDSMGGSSIDDIILNPNDELKYPIDPIKEGYLFSGWYKDKDYNEYYDFKENINKSMKLYAKWIKLDSHIFLDEGEEIQFSNEEFQNNPSVLIKSYDDGKINVFAVCIVNRDTYFNVYDSKGNQVNIRYSYENKWFRYSNLSEIEFDAKKGEVYTIYLNGINKEASSFKRYVSYEGAKKEATAKFVQEYSKYIPLKSIVNLVAKEEQGYKFIGWYLNDNLISNEINLKYEMTAKDAYIEARFIKVN